MYPAFKKLSFYEDPQPTMASDSTHTIEEPKSTVDKDYMIQVILKYLFGDDKCKITEHISDFKIEFSRPVSMELFHRYQISWNQEGEFKVCGLVGKTKPVPIAVNSWFKVGSYLKNNYIKARKHLRITI